MDINLDDFMTGGFFITNIARNAPDFDLLPELMVTLSPCTTIAYSIREAWRHGSTHDLTLGAQAIGVASDRIEAFKQWGRLWHKDFAPPNVFYTLEAARRFINDFLPTQDDLIILGIALHRDMVNEFLDINPQSIATAERGSSEYEIRDNLSPEDQYGVRRVLHEGKPLPAGGNVLGYEALQFWVNDFYHSWLCIATLSGVNLLTTIQPNRYSLLNSYQDALFFCEWIKADEQEELAEYTTSGDEINPYYPWLYIQYPITAPS